MGRGSRKGSLLSHLLLLFLFAFQSCNARNNISVAQWIKDGEKITSEGNVFELGFFSPGKSSNRYVGMWYKKFFDQRAVWVANRENPLTDSSGVLKIGRDGNLVLLDGRENRIWSTNISGASNSSIALLLDIGNLVLTGSNSDDSNYLWESFNHPTDTALNEMKLGVNIVTGEKRFLTSWKSDDDPSPGNFIWGIGNNRQLPQAFIWERHNMSVPYFRSGEWRGTGFIGLPNLYNYYFNGLQYVPDDKGGIYYKISSLSGISTVILLDYSGNLKLMNCSKGNEKCTAVYQLPQSKCSLYGTCGTFGICNALKSPICSCMRGFDPKFGQEWSKGNWSGGCVRKTQLQCEKNNSMDRGPEDRFIRLKGMRLPNFANYLNTLDADECKDQCYRNCSCMAYAYVSQIGCLVWAGELIDLQQFASGAEELYVRVQLGKMKKIKAYIIVLIVLGGLVALISSILCWLKMKQKGKSRESAESADGDKTTLIYGYSSQGILLKDNTTGPENPELLQFELSTIATATNNFFDKLGEGGFGPVYWGKLLDGQEIAVKRLSKSSGQGIEEFKNELKLISKLQHRNLVRLLGFCIEEEERMLVYEFMPNKSLDAFLFDPTKRVLLDWSKRFNIVDSIARGLLYLHRDSRLRVIHRDLKASNILLDEDMNPKISDFGMARIFGGNQTLANTNRVVGTYGYMSPEYAMEGIFSEKSDVFSFGVLLLEILSGKRNTGFNHHGQSLNLLGYVWLLWNEGKALELMDPTIVDSYSSVELMRCIHVGLLCVQDHAVDRPTMSSIVFMLGSETTLPSPSQPVFILKKRHLQSDTLSDLSLNALTVTQVEELNTRDRV